MIRKREIRFPLATNAERICAEIMLNKDLRVPPRIVPAKAGTIVRSDRSG